MSFRPDFYFNRISDIPCSFFKAIEVKALVLDIDNTLTADGDFLLPKEVKQWLSNVEKCGISSMIVSNNKDTRVRDLSERYLLPFYSAALKPSRRSVSTVLDILNAEPSEIAVIGDQIFTDVLYGKRAGFKTILVEKMGDDIPFFVKVKRVLERPIMRRIRKRGVEKT